MAAMKSLRNASLLLAALILPGGLLLLAPQAIRAVRRYRDKSSARKPAVPAE